MNDNKNMKVGDKVKLVDENSRLWTGTITDISALHAGYVYVAWDGGCVRKDPVSWVSKIRN
jgi:hypothetical protein